MPYEDSAPVTASTSASSMGRKRSAVAPQETHTSGGVSPSWIQPQTLHRNMGRHFPLDISTLRAQMSRLGSPCRVYPRHLRSLPRCLPHVGFAAFATFACGLRTPADSDYRTSSALTAAGGC